MILNRTSSHAGSRRLAMEQAIIALRGGDAIQAESTLRRHLVQDPDDAEALAKLAEITIDQWRIPEATMLLRRTVSADPSPDRRMALIRHLSAFDGPAIALTEIELLPSSVRNSSDIRTIEASLLGMVGNHDRQIALYKALAVENPRNAAMWIRLGDALNAVGRTDKAIAALRQAIAVQPTCGEAYWTLANFKSFRFSDRDVAAMRKALQGKLDDSKKLHFEFALGKAFEDRKDFARSFHHYEAGNRIRSANMNPQQLQITQFVDLAIATFTRELFDRHSNAGRKERDPIFVLGLHRSGSTLIEQILASHPLIEGTSELPVMQQIWEKLVRDAALSGLGPFRRVLSLDPASLDAIGAEYLERSRAFRLTGKPLFVDKLPANWLMVGLIRLALPNARIIDARRHPMACGFSNFKQNYAVGVTYACSLSSIGHFYRDYLRLMQHFDTVQPGAIHHVINERLIEDPDQEIRRLLAYLDVPFDAACLDFHRNRRAVRTPSAEQVRRPLNRDGVDVWRSYEQWLDPLKEALGPALQAWMDDPPFDHRQRERDPRCYPRA